MRCLAIWAGDDGVGDLRRPVALGAHHFGGLFREIGFFLSFSGLNALCCDCHLFRHRFLFPAGGIGVGDHDLGGIFTFDRLGSGWRR